MRSVLRSQFGCKPELFTLLIFCDINSDSGRNSTALTLFNMVDRHRCRWQIRSAKRQLNSDSTRFCLKQKTERSAFCAGLSGRLCEEFSRGILEGVVDIEGRIIIHLRVDHGRVDSGRCFVCLGGELTHGTLGLAPIERFF